MLELELPDLRNGYLQVVDAVRSRGRETSPRGQRTVEVSPAVLIFVNPADVIPVGIGRKLRLEIGAAESAQLIGGVSDAAQLIAITPHFKTFVEDDDRLRGAYGPRTFDQFPRVVQLLQRDPDSRQAGVMLWRPWDLARPCKDVPCTVQLQFLIRAGKLNMIVQMRSNDVFWGLAYDAWVFANVQRALAYALAIDVGTYTHHAASLHIYVDRDAAALAALHPADGTAPPPLLAPPGRDRADSGSRAEDRWARVSRWARQAVGVFRRIGNERGAELDLPASVAWYRDRLRPFWSDGILCPSCRYVLPRREPHFSDYNQDDHQRRCRRCSALAHRDLTPDDYEELWAQQNGACAICRRSDRALVIDHDHASGETRGLLCRQCNVAVGLLRDDAVTADQIARYLSAPPARNLPGRDHG